MCAKKLKLLKAIPNEKSERLEKEKKNAKPYVVQRKTN